MKKILIAIAALLAAGFANAQQVRTITEVKTAIEDAKAVLENPKKASQAQNWVRLGQAYLDAYATALGNGSIGQSKTDVDLLMAKSRVRGTADVTVGGKPMKKVSYNNADYYYNSGNVLAMVYVTRHIVRGELDEALKAYSKAYELDAKGKKTKDITNAINYIGERYDDAAVTAYQLGDYKMSSSFFLRSFKALQTKPVEKVDTLANYNAAFTAWLAEDYDRAESYFNRSVRYGYYGADGEAFVKLADIANKKGDKAKSKSQLEKGFEKFPESQAILVGLINYYLESGEDTNQLFALLEKAKANDPKNASLFYVEGSIHEKLGNGESAVQAYRKASEVNPDYTYGYIGEGLYFFKKADAIAEQAQAEMNQKKYDELVAQYQSTLKEGIPAMEKAYEVEKDPEMKKNIAAYLKNAWYRFREDGDEAKAKYEKFAEASK